VSGVVAVARLHLLVQSSCALTVWTILCLGLGAWNLPAFEPGRSLPLWSLYPGLAAAMLAVSGANGAAWLQPQTPRREAVLDRVRVSMFLLVTMVVGSTAVGATVGVPALGAVAAILLTVCLGAGVLHPALPFVIAFAAGAFPMVFGTLFDVSQPVELLRRWWGPAGVALWALLGALSWAAYCRCGFQTPPSGDV
jgi:hypothetical protein